MKLLAGKLNGKDRNFEMRLSCLFCGNRCDNVGFGIVKKKGLRKMNTHNVFLDNAVNDELEMECIGDLTTDVCSDM